jgi:hypothetical protein
VLARRPRGFLSSACLRFPDVEPPDIGEVAHFHWERFADAVKRTWKFAWAELVIGAALAFLTIGMKCPPAVG